MSFCKNILYNWRYFVGRSLMRQMLWQQLLGKWIEMKFVGFGKRCQNMSRFTPHFTDLKEHSKTLPKIYMWVICVCSKKVTCIHIFLYLSMCMYIYIYQYLDIYILPSLCIHMHIYIRVVACFCWCFLFKDWWRQLMADEEDEDGAAGPPTLTPTTSHPPAATVTWLVQGGASL